MGASVWIYCKWCDIFFVIVQCAPVVCRGHFSLNHSLNHVGHDLQPQRQRIPVVEIGVAARNAARTNGRTTNPPVPSSLGPSSSPPTDHSDYAIIIGSSLVNGLGTKLHSTGISATSYMYRGADIPTIQSRVPYILKPGINPRYVVLQVAGNDATKQDSNRIQMSVCHYCSL